LNFHNLLLCLENIYNLKFEALKSQCSPPQTLVIPHVCTKPSKSQLTVFAKKGNASISYSLGKKKESYHYSFWEYYWVKLPNPCVFLWPFHCLIGCMQTLLPTPNAFLSVLPTHFFNFLLLIIMLINLQLMLISYTLPLFCSSKSNRIRISSSWKSIGESHVEGS
jgi:hypothetical protein